MNLPPFRFSQRCCPGQSVVGASSPLCVIAWTGWMEFGSMTDLVWSEWLLGKMQWMRVLVVKGRPLVFATHDVWVPGQRRCRRNKLGAVGLCVH